MNPYIAKVLEVAGREIGQQEVPRGSNRGPRVDEYQIRTGVPVGNPWCVCFNYFCFDEAARLLGVENPFPKTGYCPAVFDFARKNGIVRDKPQPGDVFLAWSTVNGIYRASHTGFVRAVQPHILRPQTFSTIEGNSNDEGSREGYEVCSNTRPVADRFRWVRIADLPAVQRIAGLIAKPAPAAAPAVYREPRLLIYIPGVSQAFKLPGARRTRLASGFAWFVEGNELQAVLRHTAHKPAPMIGRSNLRFYLALAGLQVDEARTQDGDHTQDEADPRQYVFVKAAPKAAA